MDNIYGSVSYFCADDYDVGCNMDRACSYRGGGDSRLTAPTNTSDIFIPHYLKELDFNAGNVDLPRIPSSVLSDLKGQRPTGPDINELCIQTVTYMIQILLKECQEPLSEPKEVTLSMLWQTYVCHRPQGVGLPECKKLLDVLILLSHEDNSEQPITKWLTYDILIHFRRGLILSLPIQHNDLSPLFRMFKSIAAHLVSPPIECLVAILNEIYLRLLESYGLDVSCPLPFVSCPKNTSLDFKQLPMESFILTVGEARFHMDLLEIVSTNPSDPCHLPLLDMLYHMLDQLEFARENTCSKLVDLIIQTLPNDILESESRKCLINRKLGILYILLSKVNRPIPISAEAFDSLVEAFNTQLDQSSAKLMANIRNDLATIILLVVQRAGVIEDLQKHMESLAMRIGYILSENVFGPIISDELPIHSLTSRPQDIEFLKILILQLRLLLQSHTRPLSVIEICELVPGTIRLLIGPCSFLDNVNGDVELMSSCGSLLLTLTQIDPCAFIATEGLGAILSYLNIYATASLSGNVDMRILAIFIHSLRILIKNTNLVSYFCKECAMPVLVDVLGHLSKRDWESCDDPTMSSLLLVIAALAQDNEAQQNLFYEANGVKYLIRLLNRLVFAPPSKQHLDATLGMSLMECIRRCLRLSTTSLEMWIGCEGMFRLLDFLETSANLGVQLMALNALLDLTIYPRCTDQLLYWKRRLPPPNAPSVENTKMEITDDTSLAAVLCELWQNEECQLGVERTPEGFISNLQKPLLTQFGRHWEFGSIQSTVLDFINSLRPKIYLMALRISETTNTEATLFGGLSVKNQVTMELIINMLDLKTSEIWLEMIGQLETESSLVAFDVVALQRYQRIAQNKILTVLNTQQFLRCRDQEEKLTSERELFLAVRHGQLQSHLLGVAEVELLARTSSYTFLVDKRLWQRAQLAKARKQYSHARPDYRIHLTTNDNLNVTSWTARNKLVSSEDLGFQEESNCQEFSGEDGEDRNETRFRIPLELIPPPPPLPTELRTTNDSGGLTVTEEGFYEVNPLALTKALMASLKQEKEWNWKNTKDDQAWTRRTKWKSNWY